MRIIKIVLLLLLAPLTLAAAGMSGLRFWRWSEAKRAWDSLGAKPLDERFDPAMVAGLPPLVQRYFLHAIQPGTPLATTGLFHSSVEMEEDGEIVSRFNERRKLTPFKGGAWMTVRKPPQQHRVGYNYYANHHAAEYAFAYWIIPIRFLLNTHEHVVRLFRNRMLFESVLMPSMLLPQRGATWEQLDDQHIRATLSCDGETFPITLQIGSEGQLIKTTFGYWNCKGATYTWQSIPSALIIHQEGSSEGYTAPTDYTLEFWHGVEGQQPGPFYNFKVNQAERF